MDQIEFQLKLHTLQRTILIKQDQLQVVEAKLDKIGSIRIQSENQIIQLISDVHKTIKSLERVVVEIKDPCYQLRMNSLYDLFRNICYTLINAVKFLAQGCQNGVQRNLFRYCAPSSNEIKGETICIEQENDENSQNQTSIKFKQQAYCETRAQIQISRLYVSIEAEKQSVMKTFPSNVVTKLNEVRANWLKIVDDSDRILEEAYYRKNESARQNLASKLHKPEYVTKLLKQELSQALKNYFKDTVQRTIKKLYSLFYLNEYQKIKSEFEKAQVKTIQAQVQTDQGMNKIKQWQRERKNYEKTVKQLQNLKSERNKINQQYLIAAGNNQLYIKRIQELERKLLTFIPINLRSIDKRISQDRKQSIKRDSKVESSSIQKQNIEKVQINPKFNMIYSTQSNQSNAKGEEKAQVLQKNEKENEIIPKKNKLKRVYTKSKLQTDYLDQSKGNKLQKKTSIIQNSLTQSSNGIKNDRNYIKSKELIQSQSLQQAQLVNSEQLKLAVAKILQFTHQIRKGDEQNQIINKQQPDLNNNIEKNQQNNQQNNQEKEVGPSNQHQILADKIVSNSSMKGVLSGLLRKVMSMNKSKKQFRKQTEQRLSVNTRKQLTSQSSLKAKESLLNIVEESTNNINYRKYKKSRNSIQKLNIFAKKIRHSKEQSSFFNLKPNNIAQEIGKVDNKQNVRRLSVQFNNSGHKTLGQSLMSQILANRTKTQGNGTSINKGTQKQGDQKNRKNKIEKNWESGIFQNLNISQFSKNSFKIKMKETLKNAVLSENVPKVQERPKTDKMPNQQNNKMIAIKSVKTNEAKQRTRCQNKITKDIIQICRNLVGRKSNTQLQNVLSHYIQAHLINNEISTAQGAKSFSKFFKNRIETE